MPMNRAKGPLPCLDNDDLAQRYENVSVSVSSDGDGDGDGIGIGNGCDCSSSRSSSIDSFDVLEMEMLLKRKYLSSPSAC